MHLTRATFRALRATLSLALTPRAAATISCKCKVRLLNNGCLKNVYDQGWSGRGIRGFGAIESCQREEGRLGLSYVVSLINSFVTIRNGACVLLVRD